MLPFIFPVEDRRYCSSLLSGFQWDVSQGLQADRGPPTQAGVQWLQHSVAERWRHGCESEPYTDSQTRSRAGLTVSVIAATAGGNRGKRRRGSAAESLPRSTDIHPAAPAPDSQSLSQTDTQLARIVVTG